MKLLALDTSEQAMSVAVMEDATLLAETTLNRRMKDHSEQLLPTIESLLAASGLGADDIDRFVVAAGPGSYTGLRIAVTTAKTFASTLHKELVGVSSLAALAAGERHTSELIVALMDARRGNVFAGGYQWTDDGRLKTVIADRHLALTEVLAQIAALGQLTVFTGPDALSMRETIVEQLGSLARFADPVSALPRASRLGALGRVAAPVADIDAFVPRYLRLTEAETTWLKTHQETGHEPYVEKV
ncbi:tRNA (adenosine(37)-N6)-threonylcarbamoyltransferase complex dimerization subunit type 1 TsaB [Lacticaseibacillus yichunensis]|uniref:tRNA (Adenosine(37)-N6)-threonylcarbamoyltransferase complex dimerization subunit type 1 TsaB n=1 Tax=Lacticaseibacillus yichunensis TaxID=2486015 RepID=A0ABW4CLN1_9LACO|nr:tRNA (adenosine(37)-N6)-threonylcarbamoyltransferase complex dimerization subunit type 1 TsaB [Lacticaseibacillus yichunensis]